MTINLNDCELIETITRDSAEGTDEEYAYFGKKHCPFGIAWELVRQSLEAYTSESGDTPKDFNVFTSKLWIGKTEDIPFMPLLFTASRSH
jgi:hypothetical protein